MHKFLNFILVVDAAGLRLRALFAGARRRAASSARSRGYERGIEEETENMRLLNAEWSSLTRPDRLRALAEQHPRPLDPQGPADRQARGDRQQGSRRTRDQARGRGLGPDRRHHRQDAAAMTDATPRPPARRRSARAAWRAEPHPPHRHLFFGVAFLAIAGQLTHLTLFPKLDDGPPRHRGRRPPAAPRHHRPQRRAAGNRRGRGLALSPTPPRSSTSTRRSNF